MKLSTTLLIAALITAIQCNDDKASVGEHCGGSIDPMSCQDGLECYYLAKADRTLPGICIPIEYVATTFTSLEDDLELETSIPRLVGKGEHCGGFIMNAPKCKVGLTCVFDSMPDLGGTCE